MGARVGNGHSSNKDKLAASGATGSFADFLAFARSSLSTTQRKDNKQGAREDPELHLRRKLIALKCARRVYALKIPEKAELG